MSVSILFEMCIWVDGEEFFNTILAFFLFSDEFLKRNTTCDNFRVYVWNALEVLLCGQTKRRSMF